MECTEATITIPVRNVAKAREWYERMLGMPPELEPVPGIVEFRVGGTWLQLEEGRGGSNGWVFRFGVQSLESERSRLRDAGVAVGETITVPGVIRFSDFTDPDGNVLSLYELLVSPKG